VSRPHTGVALAALALAQFMVILDSSIVNVALPSIQRDLDISVAQLSWVVDGYLVTFAGLLLLGGRLSDLLAGTRVFHAGLLVFLAASVACAAAPSGGLLVAARLGQGVGGALLAPAALALAMGLYDDADARARAVGVWGAVSGAGGVGGVLLGGTLSEHLGWPSIFLINVPIGLVSGLVVARLIAPVAGRGGRSDVTGATTVTVGIGALVFGMVEGPARGWTAPLVWLALVAGAALLVVFIVTERRAEAPLVPLGFVLRPRLLVANGLMMTIGAVMVGLFYFLPQYQQHVLHLSPTWTGLSQLPIAAAVTVGGLLAGRVARALRSPGVALVVALVVLVAGIAWLAPARPGLSVWGLVGPFLLIGTGLGLSFVYVTTLAVVGAPPHQAGLASGLVNTSRQVGGALGLAGLTAASVTDHGLDLTIAFTGAALLTLVAIALAGAPALRHVV
jgi:EmrB/QacA subfamily drug resistance transporter